MPSPARLLLVEDDEAHTDLVVRSFESRREGVELLVTRSLRETRELLSRLTPDLMILDLLLPDGHGIELLTGESGEAFPVVVLTSHGDEKAAVEAMKAGVIDYVVKSETSLAEMPRVVERALRQWDLVVERRRAESALQESEALFRSLIENALDLISVVDQNGVVLYQSPSVERVLGRRPDEVVGRSALELVHPDDRELGLEALNEVIATPGLARTVEVRVSHGDGSWPSVESVGCAFELADGGRRVVINSRDTTRRRVAEEALRSSEHRHRTLLDSLPISILELDGEGRVVRLNREALRSLGLESAEQARGQPYVGLVGAVGRAELEELLKRALRGERADGEHATGRGSEERIFSVSFISERAESGVARVICVAMDITARRLAERARRNLEEQLRQAQKMEALGQLAGGIAHDFNNLLTVIAGNTGFLEMDLEKAGVQGLESLSEVRRALEHAAWLTQQLLAFGRRQVLQPQVLELDDVVAGVETLLRRLIGEHIRLRLELSSAPGTIRADRGQIEQVILNLVVNARDAMPEGGTLTLETYSVEMPPDGAPAAEPVLDPGRYAAFRVTDTGQGMSSEICAHMFEPFFTTKPRGKGTGLGLSTVHGIVKQSGGHVSVESEIGLGTEITIHFPEAGVTVENKPGEEVSRSRRTGSETILVVEDDSAVRLLLERLLRQWGYRVFSAANGREALELANTLAVRVDVLLTDLVMPEMSGPTLGERFVELHPETAIIYMSGYADETLGPGLMLRPGAIFLRKPFSSAGLGDKLRETLDR